jgi:hypothetical protein
MGKIWACAFNARPHVLMVQGAFDSFGHEHLPRTKYDANVDETYKKPGEQAFEVRSVHESWQTLTCSLVTETDFGWMDICI